MAKHKVKKILSGVQAIAECPCDVCEHIQQCRDTLSACRTFELWVSDGIIRDGERSPTRRLYQQVYYSGLDASWEESREIMPPSEKMSPDERIQITIRRKMA